MNHRPGSIRAAAPAEGTQSTSATRHRRSRRLRAVLAGAGCLAVLSPMGMITTQTASAATAATPRPYEKCSTLYQRHYLRSSGTVAWHIVQVSDTGRGPIEVYAEYSREMSTSISGDIGLSDVSRAVGFTVQRQWSSGVTRGETFNVPSGLYGRLVMKVLRHAGGGSYMVCESYGIDGFRWYGPVHYSYVTYDKGSKYFEGQTSQRRTGPWQSAS